MCFLLYLTGVNVNPKLKTNTMKKVNLFSSAGPFLTNLDFYQFVSAQASRIKALGDATLTDEDLRRMVILLISFCETFNKAILKVQKSSLTDQILDADRKRDISIAAFKQGVRSASYSEDATTSKGAVGISILLDRYGDIASMNHEKESGALDKLIAELGSAEYGAMVVSASVDTQLQRLKRHNEEFKQLFEQRRDSQLAKEATDTRQMRAELNEQYQLLCDYVLVKAKINSDQQYALALDIVNLIRNEYNAKVARSRAADKEGNAAAKTE